ncbi:MAG: glycosyltransferase, partial [Mycobacteriales bacterium]
MTTALLHDYLDQRGGAERVVLSMLKAFPDAQLITSVYSPETTWPEFRQYDVQQICSPAEQALAARLGGRAAALFIARRWEKYVCEDRYDQVVVSSSGFAHWAGRASGVPMSWYCYRPPRWLYKPDQYFQERPWAQAVTRPLVRRWRGVDHRAAQAVTRIASISSQIVHETADVYGREVELLAPPIAMPAYAGGAQRERWALTVGRLVPYKNIDVAIRACAQAGVHLKVVGSGPSLPGLQRLAAELGASVDFLGFVSEADLVALYRRASVLLQPGEEDFGLTPLEAASQGCPAVCYAYGGALDTVLPGVTGALVLGLDAQAWAEAIVGVLAEPTLGPEAKARAAAYDEAAWIER